MKEGEGKLLKLQKLLGILKWDKIPAKLLTHSHTPTHIHTNKHTNLDSNPSCSKKTSKYWKD